MKHTPVTIRPAAPWYTDEIRAAKQKRRKLERNWRNAVRKGNGKDIEYKLEYKQQCQIVGELLLQSKTRYYNKVIEENSGNQKRLFQIVRKLLHMKSETQYPSHSSLQNLANAFADYFSNKITQIRSDLHVLRQTFSVDTQEEHGFAAGLSVFTPATEDEIGKIIRLSPSKSCSLDSFPTQLVKKHHELLTPTLTQIVNLSLSTSIMPDQYKDAILTPLLKKVTLDFELLNNFRPVSNLSFSSKIIEKVVASRMKKYIMENDLQEELQSAYKEYHSTETALLCVQNDILNSLDQGRCVLLILLDLSAAFDTVDHKILINILRKRLSIDGKALSWLRSYLTNRTQTVCINGVKSTKRQLKCGVPQGSVLGPILFTVYTLPLGDIIRKHDLKFHLYADDTQLYLSFQPSRSTSAKIKMERCIHDIRKWMACNFLKLNDDKTEMLVIGSKFGQKPDLHSLQCGNVGVNACSMARNIGVVFDSTMTMEKHVKNITQSAFMHLNNIWKIRRYLTQKAAETIVHAFITSRLDYCNGLLYGLPQYMIKRLQYVQNAAARVVTSTRKFEHITPILQSLHWLPVADRIEYKIIIITYKALHGMAPKYLQDVLVKCKKTRLLRINDQNKLVEPKTNLVTYGDRAFSAVAPRLYNRLPLDLRKCESYELFKQKLKTHIFKKLIL